MRDSTKFQVIEEDFIFSDEPKVSINKSELIKAVSAEAQSGEPGFAFIPTAWDEKKRKKEEDDSIADITKWAEDAQKTLEDQLKDFYKF